MTRHAVVIAGGGPTGLMLAGELGLAGIDAVVVERRPNQDLAGQRAGGLLSRTIEVAMFAGMSFVSDLPTRHNYVLGLWQNHIERILAGWVGECSDAACPIWISSPPTVRGGSSPCRMLPGRCSSTSESPATSTSLRGQIGFS